MPDKIPGVTVSQRLAGGFNMRVDESADAMTESELARKASVSIAALRKWRREGRGPRFLKLGRLIRYLAGDVDIWLHSHAFGGSKQRGAKDGEC
jgi:predicted DNA-binding transcriptional regulator AlpA